MEAASEAASHCGGSSKAVPMLLWPSRRFPKGVHGFSWRHRLALAGSGWLWLALADSGCLWLALVGALADSGWLRLALAGSGWSRFVSSFKNLILKLVPKSFYF